MRMLVPMIVVSLLIGCGVTVPQVPETASNELTQQIAFDAGACADALAQQAEFANVSPAFKASEVLDGILHQGSDCGIPADFSARVRAACPAIGAKPPMDLSADQVAAIRVVR